MKVNSFIEEIFKNTEVKHSQEAPRDYLGASLVGHPCERYIWYSTHIREIPFESGRLLRLFETGHQQEYRVALELKELGLEVKLEVDNPYIVKMLEDNGIQSGLPFSIPEMHFKYSLANGTHIGGSCDILSKGWEDFPDEWVNTEIKTFSETRFKSFLKEGIRKSNPQYYAQAQFYMGFLHLKHTVLIGINKNTDDMWYDVIDFNEDEFNSLKLKAEYILSLDKEPHANKCKECKFCPYASTCATADL